MTVADKYERIGFRILKAVPRPVRRPASILIGRWRKYQALRLETPITLTLYVTSRCNARCYHCFYWKQIQENSGEELEVGNFGRIAETLRKPLRTLMLTGGEPLMRNDLGEICNLFFEKNQTQRITIATNGFLQSTAGVVSRIAEAWPNRIIHTQVSLDGPSEVHNAIRGVSDGYEKTIQTIKELVGRRRSLPNLKVSIMTTVCSMNINELVPFVREVAEHFPGILHKFNIMRGSHYGTYGLPESVTSDLDPSCEKLNMAPVDRLDEFFEKVNELVLPHEDPVWQAFQKLKWEYSIKLMKNPKVYLKCTAGYSFGVIYQDGAVALCESTRPFGNLRDFGFDFRRLWHSETAELVRNATRSCTCIHPCNVLDSLSFDGRSIARAAEL